jgi:ribosomal protein L7/L12
VKKYQVCVRALSEDRAAFVRALRTVGGISLKRALELSVYLDRFRNTTLVAGVEKATAEHVAETLIASGAAVGILESSVNTPMMCCPEAEYRFKWGRLRSLKRVR